MKRHTLSATEAELLAAVVAIPLDDLPRLVYADWLEEADRKARADYIRAACAYERMECDSGRGTFGACGCERCALGLSLGRQCDEMIQAGEFGPVWSAMIVTFGRGFLTELAGVIPAWFLPRAESLLAAHPLLTNVNMVWHPAAAPIRYESYGLNQVQLLQDFDNLSYQARDIFDSRRRIGDKCIFLGAYPDDDEHRLGGRDQEMNNILRILNFNFPELEFSIQAMWPSRHQPDPARRLNELFDQTLQSLGIPRHLFPP